MKTAEKLLARRPSLANKPCGNFWTHGFFPPPERPIFIALGKRNLDAIKLLVDHGADVNVQGWAYNTPLHYAVRSNDPDIVRFLLDHGARVDAVGPHGYMPFHLTVETDRFRVVELLIERGADVKASFAEDPTRGVFRPIPLTPRKPKRSMLHLAAEARPPDGEKQDDATDGARTAEVLIRYGAEVNVRDSDGDTPLHYAVRGGRLRIMELLLSHGADPNLKGRYGNTPLHCMASQYHPVCLDIAGCLLNGRADPNVRNDAGRTPLSLAREWNRTSLVDLLLQHGAVE